MRHVLTLLLLAATLLAKGQHRLGAASASSSAQEAAVRGVLARTLGSVPTNLHLAVYADSTTRYAYRCDGTRLYAEGNNGVSLCRGLYDYMKQHGYGLATWSGSNMAWPSVGSLPADTAAVVSPTPHHYLYNVVTYGYTMPFWDWAQWEHEIDLMALHGFDMPLALNAYESIISRVWEKMGLTTAETEAYFSGPAHLPWNRMGNLSGHCGPLSAAWHKRQVALQHRILQRMDSLGMSPICPGFAGFVPEGLRRLYPEAQLQETSWSDGHFHAWMLSPSDPLFQQISTAFVREWEAEFGPCRYYLVDSFNEMDLPFPPKADPARYTLLADYGRKVYDGLRCGNPEAVWVMQGWMFGYQRDIWDDATLAALLSAVPDDKMLLLDLAVDYNRHWWHSEVNWEYYDGFHGKPWVYSVIPNMGGKTGLTGVLDFYANGHLDALRSPHRGRLTALGMSPEGTENNEMLYELLSDAQWRSDTTDLDAWYRQYATARYGSCPAALADYFRLITADTYATFTDHPRYAWQLRPGTTQTGTIRLTDTFFDAVRTFGRASADLGDNALYAIDLAELTALYLGGQAELALREAERCYAHADSLGAHTAEADLIALLRAADALLASHPTLRLDRWTDFARRAAEGDAQTAAQYESEARRLVTVWGPPVDDYSARVWSGLLRDYYVPRFEHYFEQRRRGTSFDFAQWEDDWVEHYTPSLTPERCTTPQLVAYAVALLTCPPHADHLPSLDDFTAQ